MPKSSLYEQPFRDAVIRAYADGTTCTWTALCAAVAPPGPGQTVHMGVYNYAKRLVERGVITTQTSPNGGTQTSPHIYNASALLPTDATLWHAVAPFMADEGLGAAAHKQVKDALRFALVVDRRGPDALRAACEAVPAAAMHGLPARVIALATADPAPISRTTAASHESAIRRLLRYAAARDLVPLVFPQFWGEDAWQEVRERYLGLAGVLGSARHQLGCHRTAWNSLHAATLRLFPENPPHPLAMTRAQALAVVDSEKAAGERARGDRELAVLRYLAREHGVGPLAGCAEGEEATALEDIYLRGADGSAASSSWDGMLLIVRHHGFPETWTEFLRYYHAYSTLSDEELEERGDEFPLRTAIRELKAETLLGRMLYIRGILGGALRALEDPTSGFAQRGLTVADLDPVTVLAHGQRDVMRLIRLWWEQRAKDTPEKVSHALSKGVVDFAITWGQLAFALYARSRHVRGQKLATTIKVGGEAEFDLLHEEAAQKTPDEQALYDAYLKALTTAAQMRRKRSKRSRKGGKNDNTIKDIAQLIEQVPPKFYADAIDAMHQEIEALDSAGKGDTHRAHVLVADAYAVGFMASTACRISEATHVRLDLQHTPAHQAKDAVAWLADDRKNGTPHEGKLRERWLPRWLRARYLERTRPYLMRSQYERQAQGAPDAEARAALLAQVQEHPWLLVNSRGTPYGHPWEIVTEDPHHPDNGVRPRVLDDDDEDALEAADEAAPVRDPRARWATELDAAKEWQRRKSILRGRFKTAVGRYAARAGWRVPTARYTLTPHGLRNVMGYIAFVRAGLEAAMHLLGDGPDAIRKAYSLTSQAHVDNSDYGDGDVLELPEAPRSPGKDPVTPPVPMAGAGDVAGWLAAVQQMAGLGLTGTNLDAAAQALRAQYGLPEEAPKATAVVAPASKTPRKGTLALVG
jgi:hypothetical protein